MKKLAAILRSKKNQLGLLITHEMGKILPESIEKVAKSAGNCDFYAINAEKCLRISITTLLSKACQSMTPWGQYLRSCLGTIPFAKYFVMLHQSLCLAM
jgi:succinate-semialdehyde dehydrogenase/glutarate-semialdehyde dehydrogenase